MFDWNTDKYGLLLNVFGLTRPVCSLYNTDATLIAEPESSTELTSKPNTGHNPKTFHFPFSQPTSPKLASIASFHLLCGVADYQELFMPKFCMRFLALHLTWASPHLSYSIHWCHYPNICRAGVAQSVLCRAIEVRSPAEASVSRPALGPTQPPVQRVPVVLSLGFSAAGAWR
jgi:hypothetical protein